MDYSFSAPTAMEFKTLYDETGWGDWALDRFERALSGSWIVCTVRDDAGRLVGMGRLISDGALHAFVTEMIVTEEARGGGIGGQSSRALSTRHVAAEWTTYSSSRPEVGLSSTNATALSAGLRAGPAWT
ncbi:GNAT family N-acetyltransferase [Curtobacterium sp. MCPF17_050]|uniref:GNAT family N-acetyltransferase n=1 Tax=Curtobacterium sp. MCPF17_050 TaxID=2175664 RepID=UPI000D8EEDDA|nr:GNAT family N-acetyltransferase [Curtobacterium sp. MCPF17_050]WIB15531.1 GNAT family N-acetyltransferase [Curtobacterium sp. MCPF17_050]